MAKTLRIFGKKRGDRRTDPDWVGAAGEAALYTTLFVISLGIAGFLIYKFLVPEWWANRHFNQTTCEVTDKRVGKRKVDGEWLHRPEIQIVYTVDDRPYGPVWTYDVRFEYEFGSTKAESLADQFEIGERYVCWYDPINPANVVVERGLSGWLWLGLVVPVSVMVFSGHSLLMTVLNWLVSDERRATEPARRKKPGKHDIDGAAFPYVPVLEDIVNSPGTELRFRLPSDVSHGWRLFGLLTMAFIYLIVLVAVFVWSSPLHQGGGTVWMLAMLSAIALLILGLLCQELGSRAFRGSTRLEVAQHPFKAGQMHQVFLSQSGRAKLRHLELSLICQERATYTQGTDARTECQEVYTQSLYSCENETIAPEKPFQKLIEVYLPPDAMHSFLAPHNQIDWFLRVTGEVERRGEFERSFMLGVEPQLPGILEDHSRSADRTSQAS